MLDEAAAREAAALRTYTLGGGTRIQAAITNEISSRHGVAGDACQEELGPLRRILVVPVGPEQDRTPRQ